MRYLSPSFRAILLAFNRFVLEVLVELFQARTHKSINYYITAFSAFLALAVPIFVTLISNYGLKRYIARLEKREKDLMMQLRRQNQNEQNSVKLLLSLFGVRYVSVQLTLSCTLSLLWYPQPTNFSLLCCWTPMIAWQVLRLQVIKVKPTFCDNFHAWATIFPWISPVSNALLYSFVRKQFQQSLTQFFRRGLKLQFFSIFIANRRV